MRRTRLVPTSRRRRFVNSKVDKEVESDQLLKEDFVDEKNLKREE